MSPVAPIAPVLVVHAGAGSLSPDVHERAEGCRDGLRVAITRGRDVLESGGDATTAVRVAVQALEDVPLFNAGHGSALCADGTVEMSAALMRGTDRRAGAVAGVRTTRNPIVAAAGVFDSFQVLLAGPAADIAARRQGAEQCANDDFVTDRQRRRLRDHDPGGEQGTVGAVCLDAAGGLAAATSTGGINGQPRGRVGDSPLIGAGTWADDWVAVSCTGDGEAFVRAGAAARLAAFVQAGSDLARAADRVLADVRACGGAGGLIAVGAGGAAVMPYTSEMMLYGIWRAGGDPAVYVPGAARVAPSRSRT